MMQKGFLNSGLDWGLVAKKISQIARDERVFWLNNGQRNSLLEVSSRIRQNGVIIADEVGMGKTRIAIAIVKAVIDSGGRVAVLIPPGLYYQWKDELSRTLRYRSSELLRSRNGFYNKCPDNGWFSEKLVFISHNFGNWRFGSSSNLSHVAILSELYACIRKELDGRRPRSYREIHDVFRNEKSVEMAEDVVRHGVTNGYLGDIIEFLKYECIDWGDALKDGAEYSLNGKYRLAFERSVGVALGAFNLLLIDEAHKSKHDSSSLSRILNNVLFSLGNHRVLGLTATPVELETEDWLSVLDRIKAGSGAEVTNTINEYLAAVSRVRKNWQFNNNVITDFNSISIRFRKALSKYVIRRDKSEDENVRMYEMLAKSPWRTYRQESEIMLELADQLIDENWRKAVLAAEALSYVADLRKNPVLKKLRLGLASGHGISAFVDRYTANESDSEFDEINRGLVEGEVSGKTERGKLNESLIRARQREEYWKERLSRALRNGKGSLFNHPVILRVTEVIETEYISKGKKVLVFGRFNQPLRVLTQLLNAREMLRRLDNGLFWPQYSIEHGRNSLEISAIESAISQLKGELVNEWTIERIEKVFKSNERIVERRRTEFRRKYMGVLMDGLDSAFVADGTFFSRLYCGVLSYARRNKEKNIVLSRALYERLGMEFEKDNFAIEWSGLFSQYIDMLRAIVDNDRDEFADQEGDDFELDRQIELVFQRLEEEFSGRTPKFARFMYGETEMHSRRIIQQSFNQLNSFLKVLVAQSRVGKEGLNLHRACNVVIMIHPEWNPGAAEQEIGRVDRVGSYWAELLKNYEPEQSEIPRIEFRPVIFRDTYDEYNWKVLRERWDDYRAQLHGIVISDRVFEESNDEERKLIDSINGRAPKFGPRKVF